MNKRIFSILAVAGAMAVAVSACKDDDNGDPNPPATPSNNLTIDGNNVNVSSVVCSPAGNFYSMLASTASGNNTGSLTITFASSGVPAAGSYTLVTSAPQANQANIVYMPNQSSNVGYNSTSGTITVTVTNGNATASFNAVSMLQQGSTNTATLSGNLMCTGGTTTTSGTTSGTTTGTGGNTFTFNGTALTINNTVCESAGNHYAMRASTTTSDMITLRFPGNTAPTAGTYAVTLGTTLGANQVGLDINRPGTGYVGTGGNVVVTIVGAKPRAEFSGVDLTSGIGTVNASASFSCP